MSLRDLFGFAFILAIVLGALALSLFFPAIALAQSGGDVGVDSLAVPPAFLMSGGIAAVAGAFVVQFVKQNFLSERSRKFLPLFVPLVYVAAGLLFNQLLRWHLGTGELVAGGILTGILSCYGFDALRHIKEGAKGKSRIMALALLIVPLASGCAQLRAAGKWTRENVLPAVHVEDGNVTVDVPFLLGVTVGPHGVLNSPAGGDPAPEEAPRPVSPEDPNTPQTPPAGEPPAEGPNP